MAEWTEKEIEELLAEMTKKAMTDAEFRKEVLEDATAALEKLAGRPLPRGASLKCIERDPNYQRTFVLPDMIDEERLDDESLANVAGGISVAAIVSVCAAAAGVGPDFFMCVAKACAADVSLLEKPLNDACLGQVCLWNEYGVSGSSSCAGKTCLKDFKASPSDPFFDD